MSRRPPDRIGDLVANFLADEGLSGRLDLASAVDRWPAAVGPQVAAVTRAEAVSADGILWVRVISSGWAAELSLMSPGILARLNEGREGRIRELRCRIGPIDRPAGPPAGPPP
jgi:predicted nucleic acid-binding Zn ribbon protein